MRRSHSGVNTNVGSLKTEREAIESMTESFTDLVLEKMARDPAFRAALHREALDCLREGDIATGRDMLRDYFNEDLPDLAVLQPTVPSA
jgi:hypothetical protein